MVEMSVSSFFSESVKIVDACLKILRDLAIHFIVLNITSNFLGILGLKFSPICSINTIL